MYSSVCRGLGRHRPEERARVTVRAPSPASPNSDSQEAVPPLTLYYQRF
jgi:hypothetical protein